MGTVLCTVDDFFDPVGDFVSTPAPEDPLDVFCALRRNVADDYGIRTALLVLVPVTFVAGAVLAWAGGTAGRDVSAVQVAAAEAALRDAD